MKAPLRSEHIFIFSCRKKKFFLIKKKHRVFIWIIKCKTQQRRSFTSGRKQQNDDHDRELKEMLRGRMCAGLLNEVRGVLAAESPSSTAGGPRRINKKQQPDGMFYLFGPNPGNVKTILMLC